ncbi:MAG: hypothetical protein SGBAC_010221 [Bacillariaceae sp.]
MSMTNSHRRSMENIMQPADTDESGSLHFEAAKEEDTAPVTERKVCFNGRVRCRRAKKHQRIPESNWYSKDEIASFRKRDKVLQSLIASGNMSVVGGNDTEGVSLVGLFSQRERKQRIKRIKEAQSYVLGEQVQQQEEFRNDNVDGADSFELDQESIAEFYSIYSRRATKVAHMKGLQVSWHIENLWEEESTDVDASRRSCGQRSCSQRSKSTSGHHPQRNSSNRSTGSLLARLTTVAY